MKNLLIALNYNNAEFLDEFLTSLYMQDTKNWDCVLVDDCSTDRSLDIIHSRLKMFPNLTLVQNESNFGINQSIREALKSKYGRSNYFVKIIATDDLLAPGALAVFSDVNKDVDFAYSDGYLIDVDGKVFGDYKTLPEYFFSSRFQGLGLYVNFYPAPTALIKSELLLEALNTFTHIRNAEDWPLLTILLSKTRKVQKLNFKSVYYRKHRDSLSYNFFNKKAELRNDLQLDIQKILLMHQSMTQDKFLQKLISDRYANIINRKRYKRKLLHKAFLQYKFIGLKDIFFKNLKKVKYFIKFIIKSLGYNRKLDYAKYVEKYGLYAVNDLSDNNEYADYIRKSQIKLYYKKFSDIDAPLIRKVLDYGCGTGKFYSLFKKINVEIVHGFEPCNELANLATGYDSIVTDLCEINDKYDLIFVNNVVGGLDKRERDCFLSACKKHLAPFGILFLVEVSSDDNYVELTWNAVDINSIGCLLELENLISFRFYEKNVSLSGRIMQKRSC